MQRSVAMLALVGTLAARSALAQPAPAQPALRPWARAELARLSAGPSPLAMPRYALAVSLADAGRTVTVDETLRYTNTTGAPLREVILRVYANATRPQAPGVQRPVGPALRFVRGSCEGLACVVSAPSDAVLAVQLASPLAPGAAVSIRTRLEGTLLEIAAQRTGLLAQGLESLSSLGASHEDPGDYGLFATGEGIVSLANFYPVLARRNAAGWERSDHGSVGDFGTDDLADIEARFELPEGYTLATSGVTVRVEGVGGRRRHWVSATAVRDFAALCGATLQHESRRVGEVEVRAYYLPAHRAAGRQVLDTAARALATFEQRFGPYPYTDLDVVEAPLVGGAGGVEFSGLVTVASMFYRPPNEALSASNQGGLAGALGGLLGGQANHTLDAILPAMLEFVTAHEVAHQYWHGLVGSDSRDHPFIDESLAQWSAAYYIEARHGAARAQHESNQQVRSNYQLMRLMGHPDGPVDRPAGRFDGSLSYAGLVYGKGPFYYSALRREAGDAAFFRALRRYVDTYRFRTAPSQGFVDALSAEVPARAARFQALRRRWLEEAHGDDDLGRPDLAEMLGPMLGQNGQLDPETRQALQQLGPLLQQLGGAQGAGAGPDLGGILRALGGGAPRPSQGSGSHGMGDLAPMLQDLLQGLQ